MISCPQLFCVALTPAVAHMNIAHDQKVLLVVGVLEAIKENREAGGFGALL